MRHLVTSFSDFKTFRGSEKLRLALRGPKGGCVATALSTGGSVFDIEKWVPRKAVSVPDLTGYGGQFSSHS